MKNSMTLLVAIAAVSLSWLGSGQKETQTEASAKPADLCVTPAAGPVGTSTNSQKAVATNSSPQIKIARVGRAAPDFEANAYADGGFKPIKLSDYKGKWVVLCFYPGDFTFV